MYNDNNINNARMNECTCCKSTVLIRPTSEREREIERDKEINR